MLEEIRDLYAYDRWANARTLGAVSQLTPEQLHRDLGSSFPSIFETLSHILFASWVWLERWEGRSPTGPDETVRKTELAGLRAAWSDVERRQSGFLGRLSAADLATTVQYRNTAGAAHAEPLGQLLRHVVNHSTYHRGQVTTMLRQLGLAAVSTDLLFYYREQAAGERVET